MSAPFFPFPLLSEEEWQEFDALRKAISDNPATVAPKEQEQFSSLFARSLIGKSDHRPQQSISH